jgi:hypothetical protein
VSGTSISPASTCMPPFCPSTSLVSTGCGSEIMPTGCSDNSRVEGMRRLSPVKMPRQRELVLTVTNNEEVDEEVG